MTRLADPLAAEQQRLTNEHLAVIAAARDKGWVKPSTDPLASAVFIQACNFGVSVGDISQTHLNADQWARRIEGYLDVFVFEPGTGD